MFLAGRKHNDTLKNRQHVPKIKNKCKIFPGRGACTGSYPQQIKYGNGKSPLKKMGFHMKSHKQTRIFKCHLWWHQRVFFSVFAQKKPVARCKDYCCKDSCCGKSPWGWGSDKKQGISKITDVKKRGIPVAILYINTCIYYISTNKMVLQLEKLCKFWN